MSFVLTKLPVSEFLRLRDTHHVVDVRSPGEYAYGHIPGSVNIPLFDDSQRAEVGTLYKNEGNIKAVLRGLDLTAPLMSEKLVRALQMSDGSTMLLYCSRGGMRSESMAWFFSTGGITPLLLDGGYKAYRNHILDELSKERKYIVLGGLTGSGKTDILKHMMKEGKQVTDLEGLASHKGSAFGALGQSPQPSTEHFANLLHDDLTSKTDDNVIWLEDESHNIGTVFIPSCFFEQMHKAPVIALMMSIETRMPRLLKEYTEFPVEQIITSVMKISKRLGGEGTRQALEALQARDYPTAIRIILEYYDKSYNYGLSKRPAGQVLYVETDTDDVAVNAARVADVAATF